MEIILIFWLLCGVVCYFIMKSKGYPNNTCLVHGVGGALLGIIWIIVVLCKKNCGESTSTSQLSDMELLSKMMDLKERGAITEAEFEEKKREILSNVKKNNEAVISIRQFHSLNSISVEAFFAACVIFGVRYLNGFLDPDVLCNLNNFLINLFYMGATAAIACALLAVLIAKRVDIRFLCLPIIIEGIPWFRNGFFVLKSIIGGGKEISWLHILKNCILRPASILLLLLLILCIQQKSETQYPLVLCLIPGVMRLIWSVLDWYTYSAIIRQGIPSYILGEIALSIGYISLGIYIRYLPSKDSSIAKSVLE